MNTATGFNRQGSDLHPELFKALVHFLQKGDVPESLRKIHMIPVEDLIPEEEYQAIDHSILKLFQRGPVLTLLGLPFSDYYKIQRGKRKKSFRKTLRYIHKYYRLYKSLSENPFHPPSNQLKAYPWIFVSDKVKLRLDGHHRGAVTRFLGKSLIPAMVLTPDSLKEAPISDDLRQLLEGHLSSSPLDYSPYAP